MGKLSWSPWAGFDSFQDDSRHHDREAVDLDMCRGAWVPAADFREMHDTFVITVELPGLSIEDIVLEIKGNDLWIYGDARSDHEDDKGVYHMLERQRGPFARKFPLPGRADKNAVSATLAQGILAITIAKASPRRRVISVD